MKTMLVLEGGALRGIYTAGVLDVLLDQNIQIDAIVGVSAGALFGINYISKQRGRCLRYTLENCKNKHYMGFYSWITTGNIMNKDFCFNKLIYETDPFDFKTFKKSKTKFYCVVTNLDTGKAEYIEIKDIEKQMEYLRASGSMPLVSKTIEIDGKKYLDGGIADSVPIEWAKKQGYDRIIVVETRPKDYIKKELSLITCWINKCFYKKYPNLLQTIKNRPKKYNQIKRYLIEDQNKNYYVIRPSKTVDIKRIEHNKEKIEEMYQLGVKDAKDKLKDLNKYLK